MLSEGEQRGFKEGHELNLLHRTAVDKYGTQDELQLNKGQKPGGRK